MKNISGKLPWIIRMNVSILLIFYAVFLIFVPMAYASPPDSEMCLLYHALGAQSTILGLVISFARSSILPYFMQAAMQV